MSEKEQWEENIQSLKFKSCIFFLCDATWGYRKYKIKCQLRYDCCLLVTNGDEPYEDLISGLLILSFKIYN